MYLFFNYPKILLDFHDRQLKVSLAMLTLFVDFQFSSLLIASDLFRGTHGQREGGSWPGWPWIALGLARFLYSCQGICAHVCFEEI